jgi:hypothetical protein
VQTWRSGSIAERLRADPRVESAAGLRSDVGGDQALGLDAERGGDEGSGSHADVKWSRLSLVGSWLASPWPRRLRPSFQAGHSHAIRGAAEVN